MSEAYLLGIDVGTTAVKTVLYNTDGRAIARASKEYPTMHPKPGWAEHSPYLWWEQTKRTIREVLEKTGYAHKNNIVGIGVSSLSPVVLPVDEKCEPLRPAIIWMDNRGGKQHDPVSRMLWIKKNEPDVFKKTYRFLSATGFINYKLTNQFTTNVTEAPITNLPVLPPQAIDSTEIPESITELLPDVCSFMDVIGEVTAQAAQETELAEGTPVVAGAVDGFSAIIGAGAVTAGRAVEFTGHTLTLSICTDRACIGVRNKGLSLGMGTFQIVSGTVSSAGGLLRWFRDNLGYSELELADKTGLDPYQIMDLEASKIPPGSDGLIILPYIAGERSPIWNINARGNIFGLNVTHSKANIIRAILESAAYGLRSLIEIAEGEGVEIKELRSAGGGSKSDLWLQIKADVLNKPVSQVSSDTETLGDAIIAGAGVGVFDDLLRTSEELAKVKKIVEPNPNNHEVYNRYYSLYKKLYEQLRAPFDELAEIRNLYEDL